MDFIDQQFSFTMPTTTMFGVGAIDNIGNVSKPFGKKAQLVTDKVIAATEMFATARTALEREGIKTTVFDNVVPNPVDMDIYRGIDHYKAAGCDMLVAIGGGSSIDSAKAIGALVSNPGKVPDLTRSGAIKKSLPPLIAVPTTAGTGSEVTSYSLITDTELHEKLLLWDLKLLPTLAILDPRMTTTCPPGVTAGCGMDALTHAIESYVTKVSNPICDGPACEAIEMIAKCIERAYSDGNDLEARGGMLLGSTMAGIAFANINLAAVHTMGKVAGGFYDLPHGISIAIFLPYVMDYSIQALPAKYARVARLLGIDICGLSDLEAARQGVEHIKYLNRTLKIPLFSELGAKPDDFKKMARLCKEDSCDPINPRPIDEEMYVKLYQMAYDNVFEL